ncbi:MAG: hypothetical protein FWG16_07540, partial [Micrococcales bacterium]|nr:hypothetical protein [Micrococcales bacterium]
FLIAYPVFFWLNQRVLRYPVPADIGAAYIGVLLISALLCACQLLEPPPEPALREDEPAGEDVLLQIRAYRIYNRMTVNTLVAVNLSITAFICYMRFLPYTGFLNSALMLCVWLSFIWLVTEGGFALLRRRFLPRYDRHAVFFMGLVFWALAMFGVLSAQWQATLMSGIVNAAFMGMSMACMFSIILAQSHQMRTVAELGAGDIGRGAFARQNRRPPPWPRPIKPDQGINPAASSPGRAATPLNHKPVASI